MNDGFGRDDYYRILQVDPGAHPEIVRAAYRTLLRALGKHPDRGGTNAEARTILEAYATLSVPERRHAYDQWLQAHSIVREAPPPPPSLLSPELAGRIRVSLPAYREAPDAPFARNFDLVLEGLELATPRVYVKAYASIGRVRWPLLFTLSRGVALAREGVLPTTDLVIYVGGDVEELPALADEMRRHSAPFRWHRHLIGVATLDPPGLHVSAAGPMPGVVGRLRPAFATAP